METRANHVWVGVVTLVLLAGLAALFLWLAKISGGEQKEYDIFFEQSVGGLAKGSQVSFAGVPAGQVTVIELWPQDPDFVRVRVELNPEIPILQGTVATISASFTGVSNVTLDGAVRDAPPINEPGPEGVPVIPTEPGFVGEIMASAPLLLERLATLTERLTRVLDENNQESIAGILNNTDQISAELAKTTPQIGVTMNELQTTLAQSTETLAALEGTLQTADALMANEGREMAATLKTTLAAADSAARQLEQTMKGMEPVSEDFAQKTMPAFNSAVSDIRRSSQAIRELTERLSNEGAGVLVGGTKLPDYQP